DRLERGFDASQRDSLWLRASVERLAGPVAEVRVLAEDGAQLILATPRHRRHDLAERRPAEAQGPARGRWKGTPAHVDGGAAQVVLVQRAEVGAEDARLLEGGGGRAYCRSRTGELQQGDLS